MQLRRFKNIVALKTADQIWGFHAHNLEVAALPPALWDELQNPEVTAWNAEINPDTQDATLSSTITKLSLNIAQLCNLKCDYCAAGGDGTYGSPVKKIDVSRAQAQIRHFLLKAVGQSDVFQIQYLGGEPLLYPQVIAELSEFALNLARQLQIKIGFSVTTNGTLITADVAQMLARYQFSVAVSLDGSAEINDRVRPSKNNKSSTALTLQGLENLRAVRAQLIRLKVNSVFGLHNMQILETYQFLRGLNLDFTEYNFLFNNNADSSSDLYIEKMRELAAFVMATDGFSELAKIRPFSDYLSRLAAQTRHHNYCGAGKTFIQSDTRGDLYTCNWLMNDPVEKSGHFVEITQETKKSYAPTLIELNNCQSCWSRHLCGGGCMAVNKAATGNRHGKDLQFCERTRALAATAIHYYAETFFKEQGEQNEKH